jgi:gliding motility-associated-like protein
MVLHRYFLFTSYPMKRFTILVCLLLSCFSLRAADYYWVGGAGNWSQLSKWRLDSPTGNVPNMVPSALDNVFFGVFSSFGNTPATSTVTLDANAFCNNMTWNSDVAFTPILNRTGTSLLNIAGNLTLASSVTYSGISVLFTTASVANLKTNGKIQGSVILEINKPLGSFTVLDSLVYATPSSNANNVIITAGTFNAPGKKIVSYTFTSTGSVARSIDISNTEMNIFYGYSCYGTNKTLNVAGSVIKTTRFYTDEGIYNIVDLAAGAVADVTIVSTTFKKLTFLNPSLAPTAGLNTGNTVDTLIFKGAGAISNVGNASNVVNYVSWEGAAAIGGLNNIVKYATMKGTLTISGSGNNTFDTLLTAPNKNITITGSNKINKHFRAGGVPCAGFTEITGNAAATLVFAPGATADINNVMLTNLAATGSITPIIIDGIDGLGNSGFTINQPSAAGTTLYWVNGSGDWNDNSHWSFSSGGLGGACIPFINDNVVFDKESSLGTYTVTTSANAYCNNMTWDANITANPINFNKSTSFTLQVYGSVVLNANVRMNADLDMRGTSAATLTTNGSLLGINQYNIKKTVGHPTAGLTLLDDWSNPNGSILPVSGILDLRNRTLKINAISSGGASPRFMYINNANITVNNWAYNGTNFSLDATNSYILANNSLNTRTVTYNVVDCAATNYNNLDVANTTFGQLTFTNTSLTSGARIYAGNKIRKLEFKGLGMINAAGNDIDSLILAENRNFFFYETGTGTIINKYFKATHPSCNGLGEITSGTATIGIIKFGANAVVNIANVYMENITATGGGGTLVLPIPFSGADAGGNTGWTISTSTGSARYWIGGSGEWNDASHWSLTSGGLPNACVPTVGDDVYFDGNSGFTAASRTVTVNAGNAYFHNMSWAGAQFDPILNKGAAWKMECWGNNLTLNPVSSLNISPLLMKGSEATILNGQCKGGLVLQINKPGSGLTLANDFNNPSAQFILVDGNFTAINRILTIGVIGNEGRDNNIALNISGSTIKGNFYYYGGVTKRTLNATNSEIIGTITAAGLTYNKVTVEGTAAANASITNTTIKSLTFTDPNSASQVGINGANNKIGRVEYLGSGGIYGTGNIIDTLIFFPGKTYSFNANTNTTITGAWFGSGSPCRLTEIKSNSTTIAATVTKTTGVVDFDYIRLQGMKATGGAAFSVREHSSDFGGNSGWAIAPSNGAAPIKGLGPDIELCDTGFPYQLNTDGFFGAPSSHYLWNDNSTDTKLTVTGPGAYSVQVSFPDGCTINDEIIIKQAVVVVAPITGNTNVCLGQNSTLSSTTPNGVWSSNNTAVATVDASGVVSGVTIGTATITYTVTNAGGCVNKQTAAVAVSSFPVVAAITGTNEVCVSGSTQLSSTTASGVWSSSDATKATINTTGLVTGVAGGTVTISYAVTNASGCKTTQTMLVTVNSLPVVAAITGTNEVCIDGTTQLSSTTASGVWSSSDVTKATVNTTGLVTGVAAGTTTISYTVTNASGCITAQTMVITVNSLPVVAAITGTNEVCISSTTQLSSTTASGVWTSSDATKATVSTTGDVTGIAAGTATISYTVTNTSGCKTVQTMVVTVNSLPVVAAITGTNEVCIDGTTQLSSTTASGVWSSSDATKATVNTTGLVTGVAAGTTTISYTVTNASGCITAQTMVITVNSLPVVAAITGTNEVCISSTTQLSSTTASGVWTSSDATKATVSTTGLVTGVGAGTVMISYTVTNTSGCKTVQTMVVTVNSLAVVAAITGDDEVCINNTTQLSSTTAGGVWSSSDATKATVSATGLVTGIAAGTTTISYTVTNASGCKTVQTMVVTVNSLPIVAAITGNDQVCINSTSQLSAITSSGVWSSSNATKATVSATGLVTGVAAGTTTISYTVTNASGCKTVQTMVVTVNSLPVVAAITGTNEVCVDGTTALSSTTSGGVWSSSDATKATVSTTGLVTGVAAGTTTISYTVTNASGCKTVQTMVVTVNSLPVVAAITGTNEVCVDGTTALSSTTSGGVWSSSDATKATVSATGLVTGVAAGTTTISYTVTNASGCITTQTMVVTVNSLPVVAAITGDDEVCINNTTQLSSTTAGGVWSSSNATKATVSATGLVTGIAGGTTTISYTVTNASGCITAQTMVITVNSLPVVAAITGDDEVCISSTTQLSSTTASGVWSRSDATKATVSATGLVTGVAAGTTTISYTVTNASGCKTAQTMIVTVNSLPVVAAITGDNEVCVDGTTALSSTTSGGVWSSSNATKATVSATGLVTGVAAGTTTISYTVTNASGCITTQTMVVTVNSLPVVAVITGDNEVCVDGTTALSSTTSGGVWSSSDATKASVNTTGIVTGIAAGTTTISYTVTNASGCITTQTMVVTVNSLPVVAVITGDNEVCVDGTTALSSTTSGGVWSSSDATKASVNTTGIVTGIAAGTTTISYTVTNASGCKTIQMMVVTVNSLPIVAAITGNDQVCINSTSQLNAITSGGVWSSSDATKATINTTGLVTGIAAGTATISYTATNASGCKTVQTMVVTVNSLPIVAAITGNDQVCINSTSQLSAITTGGVWSSSDATKATVSTTGLVTGVAAGTTTISYTVTNASGCKTAQTKTVTINKCNTQQSSTANDDVAVTYLNMPVLIDLAANDVQTGGSLDLSTISIVTQPRNGILRVNADGTVNYTPGNAFVGTDNFSYTLRNTNNEVSNVATVRITVKPIPVAVNDTTQTFPGKPVEVALLDNDFWLDEFANIIITKQPARGTITVDTDGKVVYTPEPGFKGVDAFAYQVKDLAGNVSNEAKVSITVADDGLFIPNVITPNNDGVNDFFVVPDLYKYPGSTLSIFNRWGNEVYHSNNYSNRWDGTGLNGGTYYYILKLNIQPAIKVYKGWIQVIK